jgi:dipeptidyl aminopeptidase/acylaminoacyl peptidase
MKRTLSALTLIIIFALATVSLAQEPYKVPPKEVVDILDAPPLPRAVMSPRGDLLLLAEYETMPSISYLAQPLLRIGGLRITPMTNSRQQLTFYTGLTLKSLKDGSTRRISLPDGIKMGPPRWSYDGLWLAFLRYRDDGVELWAASTKTAEAKALTSGVINAVLNSGFTWMPASGRLLAYTVIEDRGTPPERPRVPIGPDVQETSGKVSKVATYQDLLKTAYDELLFDYYAASQIIEIDALSGEKTKLGPPGIYLFADPSPGGKFILVHRIKKPYSYSVPYDDFAHTVEIWNSEGELVHLVADLPPAEAVPLNGVPTGPRSFEWQPLNPASLLWIEALDGGDPEKQVPHRDRIMSLQAPFSGPPQEIMRIPHRYSGVEWLAQPGNALVTEYNWKRRWRTTYLANLNSPGVEPKKVFDLSRQDAYNNPGEIVSTITPAGETIAVQDKDWVYLSGRGASPQGDKPFLDRMNLKTMEKKKLFATEEGRYETFVDFVGNSRAEVVISSESKTEPPNYYLFNLKTKKKAALTGFKNPVPQLAGMKKELIRYKREDGVELSGTLYLPPDYKEGERLPVVVWAYPLEYGDARVAGQVRGSPDRFTFFRGASQLFFVTQGYAVLDGAQMPVVGDPKTMNDTFVEQIVANAKAAIDTLDARGIADRKRVGVGGHSYGAFMTANLLAHCDLFAAGIARSGAYNRTLTPFGFQNERRTLWEAPEVYFRLSPFMHADKINEPILLIHGEADNNSGTFPIQSERLFHALKGFGGTARLVLLPDESHGYSARESILDVLAEMFEWFDKYVKNKK